MTAGTSELKYAFGKDGVSLRVQAIFFHVGVTTLARLSTFAASDGDLRAVLKDNMGLDADASLGARSEVSGVLCCFRSANTRTEEMSKQLGAMDAMQQSKPLMGSDYLIMRNAYELLYGVLEEADAPARVYVEKRISEMEAGDMRAESLQSVLNREQDGDEILQPQWDANGAVKLKRTIADISDPANPEELRRRLGIMFTSLVMIGLQHANRKELQGVRPALLHSYVGYLLGDHCWQLIAVDSEGHTVAAPQWNLVLKYEHAIRKRTYRVMQTSGMPFELALKESWLDTLTKERAFTTPLAISAATNKSVAMSVADQGSKPVKVIQVGFKKTKGGKGNAGGKGGKPGHGKGGGKGGSAKSGGSKGSGGKGQGKGRRPPAGCAEKTPDGRSICFGYNDWGVRCNDRNCWFVHCCGICFQSHPMFNCRGNGGQAPAASETQGKGA